MKENSSKVKKSFILGGLIGTGGLFVAKLIGLLYAIPFSSILGSDAYMSYYGTSYRIYNYLLNIFTAGIPFAISSLVAKYLVKNDYKSVLKLKKISIGMLVITGLVGMILMIIFAQFIPFAVTTGDGIPLLRRTLLILSLAVLFVPPLSAFRGYYQGHKEMSQYAFSQAFEQFFRVGFLLGLSYLLVYVLNLERKWALYISVLSTSVAAIAAILQYYFFDKKRDPEIRENAKNQEDSGKSIKSLRKELIMLAVPYLLMAILGYSDDITYSILIPVGLRVHGYSQAIMDSILSSVNYVGPKLNAIPLILAPGFVSALIPYMSEAVAKNDKKSVAKYVTDCLNVILYIAFPIVLAIMFYAYGIFRTLFYTDDIVTSVNVLRCISVEGILGALSTVIASMMVALGLGKDGLKRLGLQCAVKIVLMIPIIYFMGYLGIPFAAIVGTFYICGGNLRQIQKKYDVDFSSVIRNFVKICIASFGMWIVFYLLRKIGLDYVEGGRMSSFIKMVLNGLITAASYLAISWMLKLPQEILNIRSKKAIQE